MALLEPILCRLLKKSIFIFKNKIESWNSFHSTDLSDKTKSMPQSSLKVWHWHIMTINYLKRLGVTVAILKLLRNIPFIVAQSSILFIALTCSKSSNRRGIPCSRLTLKVSLSMFKISWFLAVLYVWIAMRCFFPTMTWDLELGKKVCRLYFQSGL